MAYQNVGTPRFYIDWGEWQKNLGTLEPKEMDFVDTTGTGLGVVSIEEMVGAIGLNPVTPLVLPVNGLNTWGRITLTSGAPANVGHESFPNYVAVLNHNFLDANARFNVQSSSTGSDTYTLNLDENIINYESEGQSFPDWGGNNGFSITTLKNVNPVASQYMRFLLASGSNPDGGTTFTDDIYIGAISFGRFYDMPHSPELNLTMTIINDGYKSIKTQGGSYYANTSYESSPKWNQGDKEIEPWSVGENNILRRRRGRRSWSLDFKYLSPNDLFSSNMSTEYYLEHTDNVSTDDWSLQGDSNKFNYNIDNDDSFESQVLNKIGNGQRFIFQPDNTNNNPDQFAICQLEQDSLLIKQESKNLYNIKLKITEVW